ncbi:carbohydrate-binding module family 20 domain-containing protein [Streptosporangium roseum]|uniref:carbohydrate-binding module family 20 domain-containing protein n=1 Tax=Streptosporangium roseum TaxID=2001 RepID=UPI00331A405C
MWSNRSDRSRQGSQLGAADRPSCKLESRFGNRRQFADMVTACHNAGVRVYVDAVVNHMAGTDNPHGEPSVYDSFTWSDRNQSPPSDGSGSVTDTTCGSSWNCLTRSTGIKGMVGWANAARSVKTVSDFKAVNSNVIGFHRGDRAWIGINDSGGDSTAEFTTGLADGDYCDVISGAATTTGCTGTGVTVSGGKATVKIPANDAVAIHVNAKADTTKIATTFNVTADLESGQTLHVVGSVPALGSWTPAGAVKLTAQGGNLHSGVIELPTSIAVEYKFIKKTAAGAVTWESGGNRTLTTPSTGAQTSDDNWK